jgi:hypothetical protein
MRRLVLAAALSLALPSSAGAVLIASGDGSGNVTPPADDPGFGRMCVRLPGLSCVYLGNGWVLTANHVGAGQVLLAGVTYDWISGSSHQLQNPDSTYADLLVFRIVGEPNVPTIPIRASAPGMNNNITLIGYGFDRGSAITWSGYQGWNWNTSAKHMRWGTNRVGATGQDVTIGATKTRSFASSFTGPSGGTTHEAQGVVGDSGGGVFLKNGTVWELAGTIHSIDGYVNQPVNTSLFGNASYFADLSYYRSQILGWVSTPECNDGLDDDGDGLVDYPNDPGCKSSSDAHERYDCSDGFDNDGDGSIDHPADAGCVGPTSDLENPQCNDGVDNDGDTFVDLADPVCTAPYLRYEAPPAACGLGPGLAPLVALLGALRGRIARRARR